MVEYTVKCNLVPRLGIRLYGMDVGILCILDDGIFKHTWYCSTLEEAINIVKKWNPEWNPKYCMYDYLDAEILALESAFPKTTVYLCDFHREQAWERWVKDHKHGLTMDEGTQLLDLLRDCAW